jgi:hypothetical protein
MAEKQAKQEQSVPQERKIAQELAPGRGGPEFTSTYIPSAPPQATGPIETSTLEEMRGRAQTLDPTNPSNYKPKVTP